MLTQQSYFIAIAVYLLVGVSGLFAMHQLWFSSWTGGLKFYLEGAIAGMLLMPAYSGGQGDTLAPALIVTLFNGLFGGGLESALAPGLWLGSGALLGVLVGWFKLCVWISLVITNGLSWLLKVGSLLILTLR